MKVKSESQVAQSCLTLSNPMDCSPLGSSVHGIFQARVLEWGAIAFSDSSRYPHFKDEATERLKAGLFSLGLPNWHMKKHRMFFILKLYIFFNWKIISLPHFKDEATEGLKAGLFSLGLPNWHVKKHRMFFILKLYFLNWKIIALQYWFHFCHTSTWISHRSTYVPSLLNLPPTSHLAWYIYAMEYYSAIKRNVF